MSSIDETVDKDELLFMAEPETEPEGEAEPWQVLIVDDDDNVHLATRFAFKEFRFAGRPVKFQSAYSAAEARGILADNKIIACMFLDVVMEHESAGLDLVGHVRQDLKNAEIRIILRTGQPGYAPEISVIQGYDINDYKEKALTTGDHLYTSMTSALRCYQQIMTIEENRRGLEMVIQASARLLTAHEIDAFAAGILTQISALIHALPDGIVCVASSPDAEGLEVFAATGRYADHVHDVINSENHPVLARDVAEVLRKKSSVFKSRVSYIYIPVTKLGEVVVMVNTAAFIRELDQKLLELFSINISVGFDNTLMYQELESLAFVDQLTGLPNLFTMFKHVGEGLEVGKSYVLGLADIDNFEAVNDGLGRGIGDKVIRHVGSDLAAMQEIIFVARASGDVFGFVVEADDATHVPGVLNGISSKLKKHVTIDSNYVGIGVTIGAVIFRAGTASPQSLLGNAGVALKSAKLSRKGGVLLFEESMNAELKDRLHITARMHHALEQGAFFLQYQPQIDLKSGKIVGVEALVRWRDGDRIIPPDQFIAIAETSGLIIPLGKWVMEAALKQQKRWRDAGQKVRMAVNVSTRQILEDEKFVEYVRRVVAEYGAAPVDLELEVTESMILHDVQLGVGRLRALQDLGIQIAIDDFGTGYSSLGQLRHLPVNRLKIDRVFIRGIESNESDRHIAEMIVRMGHAINLSVLAEGVEEAAQQAILQALGCDEVQGYFYARPLPPDEVAALFSIMGLAAG